MTDTSLICGYCHRPAIRVSGDDIYPHRPDLAAKWFWLCAPCGAYVGCHPGTDKPLGRLANADLRQAKSAAHRAFDPIWSTGRMTRAEAYAWLAKRMGIAAERCHIGMFDLAQCRAVVAACKEPPP